MERANEIITENRLEGYKHIFALNGFTITTITAFHKYLPASFLFEDIRNNRITFVSPNLWEDTFEKRFLNCNYQNLNPPFVEPKVFSLCLTMRQTENEDAMWLRYQYKNEIIVKESIDVRELLDMLECVAESNNLRFYIGEAIYLTKKDILKVTRSMGFNSNNSYFEKDFSINKYLTLLLLKRVSFKYENEVRIFAVSSEDISLDRLRSAYKAPNSLLSVDVGLSDLSRVIGRITVSPYEKALCDRPGPLGRNNAIDIKKDISKKIPDINVVSSQLLSTCPKCSF